MTITETKSYKDSLGRPGHIFLLSDEAISLINPSHAIEVTNRSSGVLLQRGNGHEHLTAIRSPVLTGGAAAGSFLFLEDGIPLRAAGFANANGLMEVNFEQAKQIEIVPGPGSALYGSNAIHGTVNVISATPPAQNKKTAFILTGPHQLSQLKLSAGSTGKTHSYQVNLLGTQDGGYRDDSGFKQQKLNLKHIYTKNRLNVATSFAATKLDQNTAGYILGYNSYEDREIVKTNSNPDAFRKNHTLRVASHWNYQLSNKTEVNVTPFFRLNEMELLMHWLPSQAIEKSGHKSFGTHLLVKTNLSDRQQLLVGVDSELTDGYLSEIQSLDTIFSYTKGTHYDYNITAIVVAPYLHYDWQITDSLKIVAGLRGEQVKYEYRNNTDSNITGKFQRLPDQTDNFNNTSPKLSLVKELSGTQSLYLKYANGFRAPQTSDLYRLESKQKQGEIASEQLSSIELGTKSKFVGGFFQTSLFYMEKKNFFFRDVDGNNVSDGKTKHKGVEIQGLWPLTKKWDLSFGLTYARHTYDFTNLVSSTSNSTESINKGDDVDSAPKYFGNLQIGWRLPKDSRLELEWIQLGSYYTDASNKHSYPGHTLVNLNGQLNIDQNTFISGKITNLTNTLYAERADYFRGQDRYFPGEERALHVGIGHIF